MKRYTFALRYQPGRGWSVAVTQMDPAAFRVHVGDTLSMWSIQASDLFAVIQLGIALFGYDYPGLGPVRFEYGDEG
jgi:hypothetical protein